MGLSGPILASFRPHPVLVETDSSFHHPMWIPLLYSHAHHKADDLLALMNELGLLICWESGVPTFTSSDNQGSQTTVDSQWLTLECYKWVMHSHSLEDLAIITELDLLASPLDDFSLLKKIPSVPKQVTNKI
ncbi:hypothetical protein DFH28DRAFT_1079137 [Melampsora americana]|nr:hypothetical protein DFH28DRAFT_1079137 [Melampsora americana]